MPVCHKGPRKLPTRSFVELALVHQQELPRKEMDEFTRSTVQYGDIDAIMKKKSILEMKEIGKIEIWFTSQVHAVPGWSRSGKDHLSLETVS